MKHMQTWRGIVVRNRMLEDPASQRFMQRKHCRVQDTGFAAASAPIAGPKGVPPSAQYQSTFVTFQGRPYMLWCGQADHKGQGWSLGTVPEV